MTFRRTEQHVLTNLFNQAHQHLHDMAMLSCFCAACAMRCVCLYKRGSPLSLRGVTLRQACNMCGDFLSWLSLAWYDIPVYDILHSPVVFH